MEPNIIDFYNETPHGVNVIDKLNEEYDELQKKYDKLYDKIKKYIIPIIITENYEKYQYYISLLFIHFGNSVRELLNNHQNGLFQLLESRIEDLFIESDILYDFWDNLCTEYYHRRTKTCQDEIINALNEITKNVNKEWCTTRIEVAFETCLKKHTIYGLDCINQKNEIIEDLIRHIINGDEEGNVDYLPSLYIETCEIHSKIECAPSLYHLVCFKCEKCGNIDNHIRDENTMVCGECLYPG